MDKDDDGTVNSQFKRNNYFFGKLLSVNDFQLEQQYFKAKHNLANRLFHGSGIAEGLEVVEEKLQQRDDNWVVKLSKGMAVDKAGNEIVVPFTDYYSMDDAGKISELKSTHKKLGLYIGYDEQTKVNVTNVAEQNKCEKNIIQEDFKMFVAAMDESEPDIENAKTIPDDDIISKDDDYSNVKHTIGQYYDDNTGVFLAAIIFDTSNGEIKVDKYETKKHRKSLISIPSLWDLLSLHTSNKKNPHGIDAKSLGALTSINNIPAIGSEYTPNIELLSDSLEFFDHTNNPKLKTNQLKIDVKKQRYNTLTGILRIDYNGPKKQEFGPVGFKIDGITIPPAILVGKTEYNPDSGNFDKISYMNNDSNNSGLELEVKDITLNHFHITLKNSLEKKYSSPTYLRYWIIPHHGTEQDMVSFGSSEKKYLDVNPITEPNHKLNIQLYLESDGPVELVLRSLGGQYKKIEFNQYSTAKPFFEIPVYSISDIPGDVISISLLNDPKISSSSKLSPEIKMDKTEYFVDDDDKFTITIQDYEKRDHSKIDFTLTINDITLNLQAIKKDSDGTFGYLGDLKKILENSKEEEDSNNSQRRSLVIRYDFEFRNKIHQCAESTPIYSPQIIFSAPENFDWHEHLIKISVRNRYLSNLSSIPISVSGIKIDGTELDMQHFEISQEESDGMFSDAYDLSWWLQTSDITIIEQVTYLKCSYEFEEKDGKKRQIVGRHQIIQN